MGEAASGVRIRRARMEDGPALAKLSAQLGYPSTPDELAARLERILPAPGQAVFVAETDGAQPRGFAHAAYGIALQSGERAELLGLVTEEGLRGRGVGAR